MQKQKSVVEKSVKGGVTTFRNGTFSELVRAYSNNRMSYDRKYRQAVHKAIEQRRTARKTAQKAA